MLMLRILLYRDITLHSKVHNCGVLKENSVIAHRRASFLRRDSASGGIW